jgi:hypothetical protein
MAVINQEVLEKYLKLRYNLLLSGRHGTGKTTVVLKTFEDAGFTYKYVSASTLDPWVDLVGVPKVIDVPSVGEVPAYTYLDLIRPQFIEEDATDAIFFDELNRAPIKVLNAIMEMIQFKSINGHKLNRLKVVWGAINPEDDNDTYSVTHLDPAQVDRFHAKIEVPYEVDEEYFNLKYPTVGPVFCEWWNAIPLDIRYTVSPRRLDYAADAFLNDCRLEDFLPVESGIKKLRTLLTTLPLQDTLMKIGTQAEAEAFLKHGNNSTRILDLVKGKNAVAVDFFVRYGERMSKELTAPFVDYLAAHKAGVEYIASLEDLIDRLPATNGNLATGALINNADLASVYKKGGDLFNDLSGLYKTHKNLVNKLANRCIDVILGSSVYKPSVTDLERLFWGNGGQIANRQSNLQQIMIMLSRVEPSLFPAIKRKKINDVLYHNKIVPAQQFLLT